MHALGATPNRFEPRWLREVIGPKLEGTIAQADRVTTRSVLS
jgi:hypothetical protein